MSREFQLFHITASSDPVAGRILRERLTERGLAEEQSGLKIELAVKPELAGGRPGFPRGGGRAGSAVPH